MKSARAKRSRRHEFPEGELMLAAMVDMMINILLFLLTLYGATSLQPLPGDPVQLASSTAREALTPRITLAVTSTAVFVGGTSVIALDVADGKPHLPTTAVSDGVVPTVTSALQALAKTTPPAPRPATPPPSGLIVGTNGPAADEAAPAPELLVECDKRVPWSVLGPLLHTAERAGFGVTRFVVRQTGALDPTPKP